MVWAWVGTLVAKLRVFGTSNDFLCFLSLTIRACLPPHLHILAYKAWPRLLREPARIIHRGQQGQTILQADLHWMWSMTQCHRLSMRATGSSKESVLVLPGL
jgi:hypothetical protein